MGESQVGRPAGMRSEVMSSHALNLFVLGCMLQFLLLQNSLVHSAVISRFLNTAITNATVGYHPAYCSDNEGWVGGGIVQSDCAEAIMELYRTNVSPRKRQEYEFLTRGVPRTSHLPYIVTPRKHDYGEQSEFGISSHFF